MSESSPRVRCLRRVVVHVDADGEMDRDAARRACDPVRPGDDVVLVVAGGPVGVVPGTAALIGRCLAEARSIDIHARGPAADLFRSSLAEAAHLEAASR